MPRVTIYEDLTKTFTAYQASSNSKYDVTVEMSAADWNEYNRVEGEYIFWQSRLENLARETKKHGTRSNPHKLQVESR